MIYTEAVGEQLSLLGFGTMRLPLAEDGHTIDEKQTAEMTACAIGHGVNYFDTAYPYHGGLSERAIGRVLRDYPRGSYHLATKFPGHQISRSYDPAAVFEDQLKKCGVEYFDFYLLHNVYENSLATYEDARWGILDYFAEQKRRGRIRHLGFSSHGGIDNLRAFLDRHGDLMEFAQIQLNYLDWTLQAASAKYELLTARGLPVWVMEPVRGGRLAKLGEADEAALKALRPDESIAAWGFRWLQGLPNVHMILSGMSSMAQMEDNVRTFEARAPLSEAEAAKLTAIAEGLKSGVPCTGCRYCCEGCPQGLDIPMLMGICNELRFAPVVNASMRIEALPAEKRPQACIACGRCARVCPQKIDIPAAMRELSAALAKMPSWAELCRKRDEEQRRNAGK